MSAVRARDHVDSAVTSGGSAGPVSAERLLQSLVGWARDVLLLAAAEARLTAVSALAMLLLVVLTAAALLVAWLLVIGCVLYGFAAAGFGWAIPALCLAAIHALLAAYFWWTTVRLSRDLTWPVLRAAFAQSPAAGEDDDDGRPRRAAR